MLKAIAGVLKALALLIIGFVVLVFAAIGFQLFIWLVPAAMLIGGVWLLFQNTESS